MSDIDEFAKELIEHLESPETRMKLQKAMEPYIEKAVEHGRNIERSRLLAEVEEIIEKNYPQLFSTMVEMDEELQEKKELILKELRARLSAGNTTILQENSENVCSNVVNTTSPETEPSGTDIGDGSKRPLGLESGIGQPEKDARHPSSEIPERCVCGETKWEGFEHLPDCPLFVPKFREGSE